MELFNKSIHNFSSYLFWDRDISKLDLLDDKRIIMERVFTRGMENDERLVFSIYGLETIRETVVAIKNLDVKTLNYLSIILQLPMENFICYKNIQSPKLY